MFKQEKKHSHDHKRAFYLRKKPLTMSGNYRASINNHLPSLIPPLFLFCSKTHKLWELWFYFYFFNFTRTHEPAVCKHPFCESVLAQTAHFPADWTVKPTGQGTCSRQIAAATVRQKAIIRYRSLRKPVWWLGRGQIGCCNINTSVLKQLHS